MGPLGTPLGSLWGYVGKTMIDPAQPDRIVPLSFIVRPATGLEETATAETVGRIDAGTLAKQAAASSVRVVLGSTAFQKVPGLRQVVEGLKEAGLEERFVLLPEGNLPAEALNKALDRAVIRLLGVKDLFVLAYAAADDFMMRRFLQKLKPWGIIFQPQDPVILKSVTRQILLNLGVPARFLTPVNILRFLTSTGLEEAA